MQATAPAAFLGPPGTEALVYAPCKGKHRTSTYVIAAHGSFTFMLLPDMLEALT